MFQGKKKKGKERRSLTVQCSTMMISDCSYLNEAHTLKPVVVRSDLKSLASFKFKFLHDTNYFMCSCGNSEQRTVK